MLHLSFSDIVVVSQNHWHRGLPASAQRTTTLLWELGRCGLETRRCE